MFGRTMISSFTILGLLSVISGGVIAQMLPGVPTESSRVTHHHVEQPLELKVGVTLGGIGLIGLELWWFLYTVARRD